MNRLRALLHDTHLRPRWRALFITLALVVAWFAFMPAQRVPDFTGQDKINHLLAFAALASTATLAFAARLPARVLALLAYGGFIEVVQSFLPTRQGDWADLVADGIGITIGLLFLALLRLAVKRLG